MTLINPKCCSGLEEKISALVDQELSIEISEEMTSHLAGCKDCSETYQVEIIVKQLIAKSCKDDRAPEELIIKIRQEILTISSKEEDLP
jgi:mycothiol system anti-sigma-R factor